MINSLCEWPPAHLCLIPSTLFLHLPVCSRVFSFLISTNLLSSRVLQNTFFLSILLFSPSTPCALDISLVWSLPAPSLLFCDRSPHHVQETEETFIADYSWRFHHYFFNNSKIRTLQVQSTHIKRAEDFLYNFVLAGEAHLQSWIGVFRSAMGLLLLHLTITVLYFMLHLCFIFKQVILFF